MKEYDDQVKTCEDNRRDGGANEEMQWATGDMWWANEWIGLTNERSRWVKEENR
jgi:hypothetical protein